MRGAGKRCAILALAASTLSLLVTALEAAPADKIIAIRAADEDPAQDATRLTNVRFVIKGGKVVKSLTP